MSSIEKRAIEFATKAHAGQCRKYTGEPYITHPCAVAEIVKQVPHTPTMIAAAILHDTVEDCDVTLDDIEYHFGKEVMLLVFWLTDVAKPEDGNRATRKKINRDHMANAPAEAQTVKAADICHNTQSIKEHDPDFWRVYRREKQLMLRVLNKADPFLLNLAWEQVGRDV